MMTASKVFFSDLRASWKENLLLKMGRLLERCGLQEIVAPRDLVAVKLHFGEKGNTAFIRPLFFRKIVEIVRALGALPFLTDTNTLYVGTRDNSISHIMTAIENGFAYSVIHAPVIIADGIRGASYARVNINKDYIKSAYIGKEIVSSDVLLSVAHFKGHELSGFGGTLKNLGMGCASRKGKLEQHSGLSPKVKRKNCIGCGECVEHCAHGAISLNDKKAFIHPEKCVGCGECILICQNRAIQVQWNTDIPLFQKKMVEYAHAVLKSKQGKSLFVNFLTNISPGCDCAGYNDAPIVTDMGIMASTDPVAIDQASVDMVNRKAAAEGSCLMDAPKSTEDKFRQIYPNIDWSIQLSHGEKLGLGQRRYKIVNL